MNTDGYERQAITQGDPVDWFPRFSPDGRKILFTRSKKGWVSERDANTDGKWDIYTITPDGKDETKVVDNASWGTWISNDEIVFVRGTAIVRRKLDGEQETVLVDSAKVSGARRRAAAAARDVQGRPLSRHHPARLEARDRDLGRQEQDLDADGRGLPDQLEPDRPGGLLGPPHRQRRQPGLAHADQGRQGRQERRRPTRSRSSTCRGGARTSTSRSCPPTASGWSGPPPSAGTTTTSPTTRSTCGRWARRPRRRRA